MVPLFSGWDDGTKAAIREAKPYCQKCVTRRERLRGIGDAAG